MATFYYWADSADFDADNAADGTLAYTPDKLYIPLGEETVYGLFIESSTKDLYKVLMSSGTVTLVSSSYNFIDLIYTGSGSAYALSDNGTVWEVTDSITSTYTGVTNPSKFAGRNHWVLDTNGDLWYDSSGMTKWDVTPGFVKVGYDSTNAVYIGIRTDGKAYSFAYAEDTLVQIGSATDWIDVNYNGYAVNSSGEVYSNMGGTPTLVSGTYDDIAEAPNAGCAPALYGFLSTTGKAYDQTLTQIGSGANMLLCAGTST